MSKLLEGNGLARYSSYHLEGALQVATQHSNLQGVRAIKQRVLESGVPVNWTAAMALAARSGSSAILAELLEPPFADLEAQDVTDEGRSRTALLWAVSNGHVDSVRLLLEAGADPNVVTDLEQSAVHLACERGHSEVLRLLLAAETNFRLDAKDSSGQTPLLLAMQSKCVECVELLLEREQYKLDEQSVPFLMDQVKMIVKEDRVDMLETLLPLHHSSWGHDPYIDKLFAYAIHHQSEKCLQFLLRNGANLAIPYTNNGEIRHVTRSSTNIKAIFRKFPNSEELLREVFDDSVTVYQEHVEIDFQVLCPENEDKMKVTSLLLGHSERTEILQHPLLSTLVHLQWQRLKYFAWYQLFSYLIYMAAMATYVCLPDNYYVSTYVSHATWVLAVHVLVFALPNIFPGIPWKSRLTNLTMIVIPPVTTMVMAILPYNVDWASIAILFTWLTLPFYAYIIPRLNRQIAMFQLVTKDMLKHGILFFYTLLGFSLTFFVLYKDEEDSHFKDFGQAFMFTSVVFLQGGLETSPAFNQRDNSNSTDNSSNTASSGGELNLNRVKHALADMRFSGIIATLLFVFVCILALMNMLIALAVKDSKEMEHFSTIIHQKHRADWLYEWNTVLKHVRSPNRITIKTIKPGDVPEELYDRLRQVQTTTNKSRDKVKRPHSGSFILHYLEAVKRVGSSSTSKSFLGMG
ncbi:transient receptor potential channel pyrexia isoform X2 [Anabrus simplex]